MLYLMGRRYWWCDCKIGIPILKPDEKEIHAAAPLTHYKALSIAAREPEYEQIFNATQAVVSILYISA